MWSWIVKPENKIFDTKEEAVNYMVTVSQEFYNQKQHSGGGYSRMNSGCKVVVKRGGATYIWEVSPLEK